ncbi:MAG: hypothetical protein IJI37_06210 [Opitutales bacterium]|nr:hypothetical protein [Opitutales bacterium]
MKAIKLFSCFCAALLAFGAAYAKVDPVSVDKIEFKQVQQQQIIMSSGMWTRVAVVLLGNENPDKKASNDKFIRDVEVTLTLVYRDEKAKNKKSPDSLLVFKNKARLFAVKVKEKTPVVFYIPFEATEIYKIKKAPFAYSIELSVGGTPVELSKDNMKSLLSPTLIKGTDPKKIYESYQKFVSSAASSNENVLMNLSQVPYNVQKYEYNVNPSQCTYMPTYIKAK